MFKKIHSSNCCVVSSSLVVPKELKDEIVKRELRMKRRRRTYALTDLGL